MITFGGDFLISRSKKVFYGLLSILSLVSIFAVGTTAQAKTTEKPLTSIPKALRGYWYAGDSNGSGILHFTSKTTDFQMFNMNSKKKSFLKFNKNSHDKLTLAKKFKVDKTIKFSQNGHNNWFDRSIGTNNQNKKGNYIRFYYLRGTKSHPKLLIDISHQKGKFPRITAKNKNPEGSFSYAKVSHKYLKSIGFFK